jgi:DNA-binding transcriptional ArsR family regulator
MAFEELIGHASEVASMLSLLANEKRLIIMSHLSNQEMSVGAIAEKVELSQSALSQHLAKMRDSGVVKTRRDRQTIYYSCNSDLVKELLEALERLYTKQ